MHINTYFPLGHHHNYDLFAYVICVNIHMCLCICYYVCRPYVCMLDITVGPLELYILATSKVTSGRVPGHDQGFESHDLLRRETDGRLTHSAIQSGMYNLYICVYVCHYVSMIYI